MIQERKILLSVSKNLKILNHKHSVTKRYFPNGTIQPEFKSITDEICLNGKIIMFKNTDLTKNCDHHSYLEDEYLHNLTDLLDEHSEQWDKCETFIIEKQMSFGKKHNTMALKIAQHCWSYFAFKYGRFKNIIEFPAYHKTQVLGAEKLKKKQNQEKSHTKQSINLHGKNGAFKKLFLY